jgi:ABC-type antimicrobial peptide transport system permease subunit
MSFLAVLLGLFVLAYVAIGAVLLRRPLITTTVGIAAGIGIGFAIVWAYVTGAGIAQPHVDMTQVLVPALLIYTAVLLVTIGPAVQASRMRTSEALRIVG